MYVHVCMCARAHLSLSLSFSMIPRESDTADFYGPVFHESYRRSTDSRERIRQYALVVDGCQNTVRGYVGHV